MSINIKLYTPYTKQQQIHKACNDETTFFITVSAGRQAGKTIMAINQALYWVLSNNAVQVYWVSPTTNQANKVYKQMLNAIIGTDIVKSYKGSKGDTEIVFNNGSTIKFRGAAQEDTLRGETIDFMICDESSFIKEEVIQEILLPMLNVRGRKFLSISTPKGKNHFYYQFLRGNGDNNKYQSFRFTSSDNPYANQEIISLAEDNLPDVLFKQEYLAEFVDNAAVFENVEELACLKRLDEPLKGQNYWIGVDIGMKGDYTVVTVLNRDAEMVYIDRFTNVTGPQLKARLSKTFELFRPRKIYIESNNQGQPIIDDLQLIYRVPNIVSFTTTVSSKPIIINNLINAFASKKIKVLNYKVVKQELEAYTMTFTSLGKPIFSAPNGFHDDIVMSLAIAYECLNKSRYSGKISFLG